MRANLERRLSAAEAARLALAESGAPAPDPLLTFGRRDLPSALESFDESRAQAILDRLFGTLSIDAVLSEVVFPTCTSWATGGRAARCRSFKSTSPVT